MRGFTLIEVLVVLAITATLLMLTLPRYFHSLEVEKVRILTENLRVTRLAIDKFHSDNGRYPAALDELVGKQYLHALPVDPMTESAQSWLIVPPPDGAQGQVYDLKSSAPGNTDDGIPLQAL